MKISRLGKDDADAMAALNRVFGAAFDEPEEYVGHWDNDQALAERLADTNVVALVAQEGDRVIGGLTAYLLHKLEAPRSELFIYDLAVDAAHRRRGVATALLEEAQRVAGKAGAYIAFIGADEGDEPPVTLYRKLSVREQMAHFFDLPTRSD